MEYELIRTNRKTLAICVTKNGKVIVRSPLKMPFDQINIFVSSHTNWIEKQIIKSTVRAEQDKNRKVLSQMEILELKKQAKVVLPPRIERFEIIMDVKPASVKITSATTRWGSCSAKNVVCLPYRLMLLPEHLQDYIIVHELAHILQKNHSVKFYEVVKRYMFDYKIRQKELKQIEQTLPKG